MDFRNEHYVRLYTRDSVAWGVLAWEGQAVFTQLYRKADATGALKLLGLEPWQLAALVGKLPEHVAKPGMERCLQRGWIVRDAATDRLVLPRYVEANNAVMTSAQRVREHRARRRAVERNVTELCNETLPVKRQVTPGNVEERFVTPSAPANGSNGHAHAVSLAAKGRFWLAEVLGRDDHDHRGKWEHAFEEMAQKPEQEKRDVARSIRQVIDKPGKRQILKPQHILDYWRDYADGQPPGSWKRDNGPQPGAAEVSAAKQAFDSAYARYREATNEESKAQLRAKWMESDKQLKATKAKYSWTA